MLELSARPSAFIRPPRGTAASQPPRPAPKTLPSETSMNSANDRRSPELPVPEEGSDNATFCRPHRTGPTARSARPPSPFHGASEKLPASRRGPAGELVPCKPAAPPGQRVKQPAEMMPGGGGESRAAGTYAAAPGSGAGSDAALSPALAPGDRITHLCTNTTHMAEPCWKPGRGVGSPAGGLGQVCRRRQAGQGGSAQSPARCQHPAGRSPHPGWAPGEGGGGG